VAIGTSLPELVTSVMAAWRRSGAVAIGNVVGSNIFNIGLILGGTAVILPLDVDPHHLDRHVGDAGGQSAGRGTGALEHTDQKARRRGYACGFRGLYPLGILNLKAWLSATPA
jgi:hypothetical protein